MNRGWHFLQIPGPSNTPQRILKAIGLPTIDHRGSEFAQLTLKILREIKKIFQTDGNVIIYPSSGTGAWEAALMNLFKPGDKVLAFETGYFAILWKKMAENIGLEVEWITSDWRHGIRTEDIHEHLKADVSHRIKGVMVVHNETSTGVTSNLSTLRAVINDANHPTLLLADVVSSLGTTPFKQDEWGVDVAICGSQKGFMLPPGLGFNSINRKALEQARSNASYNSYWQWDPIIEMNLEGFYPYTPASNLFFGLDESLAMLQEEGLENLFSRHKRHAEATRIATQTWGLENQCLNPEEYSDSTTALIIPNQQADLLRNIVLEKLNLSLGTGLGKLKGQVFRIGHLGDFNDLMLCATLSGVEMGLSLAGIKHHKGGIEAAMEYLIKTGN